MGPGRLDQLHEREGETALLEEALSGARESAALVVIEGPPGIGKTSLLHAARAIAREQRMHVLSARAAELESGVPYGIVRQLLDPVVLGADDERRAALLSGAAERAHPIFHPESAPTSRAEDPFPQLHGLFWLVGGLADEQPLTLLVDDAQWADLPSLRFLDFLARRLDDLPVTLVVATRPVTGGVDPLLVRLVTDPAAEVIRPAPLSAGGVAAWAGELLGAEPDEAFVAGCAQATGGNPFFVREMLREVARRDVAPDADAAELARSLAPDGVAAMVMLRLAGAPAGARELVEAVAVLGEGSLLPDAAMLAGLEWNVASDAGEALVRDGILAPGRTLSFAHPVILTAVVAAMTPGRQSEAHARAARLLAARGAPVEDIAAHLVLARPEGDPATVEVLRAAAARAVSLGVPASAVPLLERAVAEPPPEEELAATLLELGSAAASLGMPEAAAHLQRAMDLATDERTRARAAVELGGTVLVTGGDSGIVRVLEDCRRDVTDVELAEALEVQLLSLATVSRERRKLLAPRLAELSEPPEGATGTLAAATLAMLAFEQGALGISAAEGARLAARILPALSGEVTERGAWAALVGTAAATWCGATDVAERLCAVVAQEAQHRGTALTLSGAANIRSLLEVRRGRLGETEAQAALAIGFARETRGWHVLTALARSSSAHAALDRGATEEELRAHLVALAGDEPDSLPFETVLMARGAVLLALGEPGPALDELRVLGRRNDAWAPGPAVVQWRSWAALAAARLGDADEAHRLVLHELELARAFGAPRGIGIALRVAAAVGALERLEALREAADVLEGSTAPVEQARVLVDLGCALREGGAPRDAREPLRRALDLAVHADADGLAARAREELVAAGARPRRTALRGVESLTPSERRVAGLAAAGRTNREVAQELFVTVKTVEMHLANAYSKLEIKSRTQLPEALAADPPPAAE